MTTFLKSQQAKAREFMERNWPIDAELGQNNFLRMDRFIAQTIKDTTARVRKVLGEEVDPNDPLLSTCCSKAHNTLHRKVTQELNSLEE